MAGFKGYFYFGCLPFAHSSFAFLFPCGFDFRQLFGWGHSVFKVVSPSVNSMRHMRYLMWCADDLPFLNYCVKLTTPFPHVDWRGWSTTTSYTWRTTKAFRSTRVLFESVEFDPEVMQLPGGRSETNQRSQRIVSQISRGNMFDWKHEWCMMMVW